MAFAALVALGVGTAAHAGTSTPTTTPLQAPSAPTNLGWFYGPLGSPFQLQWQDNSSNEDGFRLEREADRSVVGTYPANAELGLLPLLDNQEDWCYAIGLVLVAFNAAGESEPSNAIHLFPPPSGCRDTFRHVYTNDSELTANELRLSSDFGFGVGVDSLSVVTNAPGCGDPVVRFAVVHWPLPCVDPGESVELEVTTVSPSDLLHAVWTVQASPATPTLPPTPTPEPVSTATPAPVVTPAALPQAGGAPGSRMDSGAILAAGVILILGGSLALKRIR